CAADATARATPTGCQNNRQLPTPAGGGENSLPAETVPAAQKSGLALKPHAQLSRAASLKYQPADDACAQPLSLPHHSRESRPGRWSSLIASRGWRRWVVSDAPQLCAP